VSGKEKAVKSLIIAARNADAFKCALPIEERMCVLIGRAPAAQAGETASIVIPKKLPEADTVSRSHARILYSGDSWWIEQLPNTLNQTCIKGEIVVGFRQIPSFPCEIKLGEITLDFDIQNLTPDELAQMQPQAFLRKSSQSSHVTRPCFWPDTYQELRWGACMEHILSIGRLATSPETAQKRVADELSIYLHAQRVIVRSGISLSELPRELEAVGLETSDESANSIAKKLKRLKASVEVTFEAVESETCCIYVRPDDWNANDSMGLCIAWFSDEITPTAEDPRTGQLISVALDLLKSFRRAVLCIQTNRESAAKSNPLDLPPEMARICEEAGYYGISPQFKKSMEEIWRLCRNCLQGKSADGRLSCVLLDGETGTGKSALARIIQKLTPHRDGPFIDCNIAGLAEGMIQAELFGTERAQNMPRHPGRFKLATHGVLFLDEIAAAPKTVQHTLLSVLDTGRFQPVGGPDKNLQTDCFVICGSNEVRSALEEGRFREDLFYRLQPIVTIPPLRERREDIEQIALKFVATLNQDHHEQGAKVLSPELLNAFMEYDWPGNSRELVRALEIAWSTCEPGGAISLDHLTEDIRHRLEKRVVVDSGGFSINMGATLEQNRQLLELEYFAAMFRACNGIIGMVAKRSGVSEETLRTRRNTEFPALVARLPKEDVLRLKIIAGEYWEKLVLTAAASG